MACFNPSETLFLTGWAYNESLPAAEQTDDEISFVHEDAMFEASLIAIDREKLVVLIIEEED